MLDGLKKVFPSFDHIKEAEFFDSNGERLGLHSYVMDNRGEAIGGGTAQDGELARRIAVAEVFERAFIGKIRNSPLSDLFMLNTNPTSCGFAAGFDCAPTMMRAICEAIERWAWSQWIDYHYYISSRDLSEMADYKLSAIARFHASYFERVLVFEKELALELDSVHKNFKLVITIGIKNNGVFAGSRVAAPDEDLIEHALLESWRHLLIFEKADRSNKNDFFHQRIFHFGNQRDEALRQIELATIKNWNQPSLKLLKEYKTGIPKVYLWRALCDNYLSWEQGSVDRFVY